MYFSKRGKIHHRSCYTAVLPFQCAFHCADKIFIGETANNKLCEKPVQVISASQAVTGHRQLPTHILFTISFQNNSLIKPCKVSYAQRAELLQSLSNYVISRDIASQKHFILANIFQESEEEQSTTYIYNLLVKW